jgi:site-specific recombinase XerD
MSDQEPDAKPAKRRQRGIFERPKESGIWWVRYHDEQGREHRERVGSEGLALKVYQRRKNEIAERRFFPERLRRRDVLVADMIDDYLGRAAGRLRCYREYERYGRFWKAALPGRTLRQVLPGDIERYVGQRVRDVAPATVNRELQFLKHLFNVAIADGKADANPVKAVKLFTENNQRVRFLTDDEETALRNAIGEAEWPMVAVAIHTGLRQAEQFKLRWEHVDFATGLLTVPRSKHGETRRVPMNDTVRDILRALPSRLKSPYVFPSATGETPLDARNYMNRVFNKALKVARIEDFTWHSLRHTFASRLVMTGVDLRTVQDLLGHMTIAMTLRYSHLSPAHRLDAVQRLNRPPAHPVGRAQKSERTGTKTGTEQPRKRATAGPDAEGPELQGETSAPAPTRTGDLQVRSLMTLHTLPHRARSAVRKPGCWGLGRGEDRARSGRR